VYVDQIGQHPLLTKEDEIELSQAYQAGLDALRKLADCAADDLARPDLLATAEKGERARRPRIESNLRLVVSIARRFSPPACAVLGDFLEDDSAGGPAVMGFSRERARQVERDALAALRRPEVRAGLPDLDGGRLRRPRARGRGRTGSWTGSGGQLGGGAEGDHQLLVGLKDQGGRVAPIGIKAQSLARPGALEAELVGADLPRELRQAGAQQLWIIVPLAVVVAAVAQAWSRR
jgi:sigma-70-like protein